MLKIYYYLTHIYKAISTLTKKIEYNNEMCWISNTVSKEKSKLTLCEDVGLLCVYFVFWELCACGRK